MPYCKREVEGQKGDGQAWVVSFLRSTRDMDFHFYQEEMST